MKLLKFSAQYGATSRAEQICTLCVNSGMFQVPDSHPTLSDFRSGFGDSSLVLFWSVWSGVAFAALLRLAPLLLLVACMHLMHA